MTEADSKLRNRRGGGASSPDSHSSSGDPLLVDHPADAASLATSATAAASCPTPPGASSQLDRLLMGYTSFLQSGLYQDRSLKVLQWTLWMLSHFGARRNAIVRDALKKLSNELSFARYLLRFLQLPLALEAAKTGSWAVSSNRSSSPRMHKWLGRILAWSMLGYYPLEYGAYLQWQTPQLLVAQSPPPPSRLAEKWSAWSCRCWLAYLAAEMVQCGLRLREETQWLRQQAHAKKTDGDSAESDDEQPLALAAPTTTTTTPHVITNLRLQLLRDALFTLPAIHWSLPNWDRDPWLPEPLVNTLMWLEAVVCMYQSVVSFQQPTT